MLIDPRTFRRLVAVREQLVETDIALYGTTPHQLRTRARVDRAKELLAAGTPVTDVCMEVGVSSLGSFSALFTRWVGAPPTRYRRSVQVPRSFAPVLVPGCLGMLAQLPRNSREASRA